MIRASGCLLRQPATKRSAIWLDWPAAELMLVLSCNRVVAGVVMGISLKFPGCCSGVVSDARYLSIDSLDKKAEYLGQINHFHG